ncbi:MAG: M14 family metallopeptidase [Chloroflexi bacterium]|nr:M14 family metallopeptidase [Chloroflexota bacterium]MCA2001092.1 M14 family metallopeptidase [Chloroflexota bacterium]
MKKPRLNGSNRWNNMTDIPANYEFSRERFRASASAISDRWAGCRFISHALADSPDLMIDVISADATREKQKLLIITTGLHGVEGYVGAAVLQLFIEEYPPRLEPETTGLLLVHPINPYGMKRRIRVNQNGVDLNRNFEDDLSALKTLNPHYESLASLLNPARPLKSPLYEKLAFAWNVLKALPRGASLIRETALMGQYRAPDGMYFGGFEPQEETKFIQRTIFNQITEYAQIVFLDIHTGYGPRWQMTLCNPPSEKMSAQETAARFGVPRAVGVNPEEFYTIHGDMVEYFRKRVQEKYPEKKMYAAAFEFGTYGDSLLESIHSLRTTVFENCLRRHGGSDAIRKWMKREYDELFVPSDPKWLKKAEADARQAFEGILRAEGFFKEESSYFE